MKCSSVALVAVLTGIVSAQVTFTIRAPAELGIDSILGYNRCAFVDYDQDGHIDFFSAVVYKNDGTGHFRRLDSTRILNLELVDFADFDGNGYPDIVTNRMWGGNNNDTNRIFIYRNEGPPNWTLRDVSDSLGLGYEYPIYDRDLVDPAWFDYDGDGWLDFYLSSYEYPVNSAVGQTDYLFRNHAAGLFVDVSDSSQISWYQYCSRGVSLLDYDEDGDVDVFVSVYRLQPNLLYENNGNGTFDEVAEAKGVAGLYIGGYYGHNIGAAVGDYDNDGHQDIFTPITHHPGYPGDSTGHLWICNGPPNWDFTCRFAGSGLINSEIGSSPTCADFDNDGDLDIIYTNLYGAPSPNTWLFRNEGSYRFTDVTDSVGLGIHHRTNYAYWADFTNDGFLDIFWARYDGAAYYYEFFVNSGNGNHWFELDLVGLGPNTSAIGARVDLFASGLQVTREVLHNQGMHYGNAFLARQHFGLGANTMVDSLVVRWSNQDRHVYRGIRADTIVRIAQAPHGVAEGQPAPVPGATIVGRGAELELGPGAWTVVDVLGRACWRGQAHLAAWRPVSAGVYFVRSAEPPESDVGEGSIRHAKARKVVVR